jgi:hypothetical protein
MVIRFEGKCCVRPRGGLQASACPCPDGPGHGWLRGQVKYLVISVLLFTLSLIVARPSRAQSFGCTPAMANDIVCENSKPGNPPSEWDISGADSGAGDLTIQGFATDISVNQGQTIFFKINTNANAYTIEIYRIGYYNGNGARKIATFAPSVTLPQTQPVCITDNTTNLVDCGNWAVSASWQVPSNATSGVYIAHLIRSDTGGNSHIAFIVRNDSSHSSVLYETADETWQAYNDYGGHSLYGPSGAFDSGNRAFKVSYNRPFDTRSFESASWLFSAEYPMIRWLEANGYDATYFTHVDGVRSPSQYQNHKILLAAGHDEYWSGPLRANVEAARDAGVSMAFFTGNEVFWKTRWENSIDSSNTPYRTLVCYKETLAGAKIDPTPTWTGTWRDPRFSPPSDGGRPENKLTGTIFAVNGPGDDNLGLSIKVPATDGKMRFWRNTAYANLSPGQTATLPAGTLGYEWDSDLDNGSRPAGLFDLSTATYALKTDLILDYGGTFGAGTATHHLTLYKAPSGALVFGAGTVRWSWGLDSIHDAEYVPAPNPDVNMQQATLNLFADMGVQPASLQSGLVPATRSTDTTAPTSTIVSPAPGATISTGTPTTVSGTASDSGGGVIGGVEVSVDGGMTWHAAAGRNNWTYNWTPAQLGAATIQSRAVDDSGNLETPSSGIVVVTVAPPDCPCAGWNSSPFNADVNISADGPSPSTTIVSPSFSTTAGNELLLAFIATDYVGGTNTSVTSVTGGGLTWALVVRSNGQSGTSEIWRAFAAAPLSNVIVTATLSQSVDSSITVKSFAGVDTSGTNGSGAVGATKSASAISGAPTVTLTTTRNNSWVFGVGNDFDNAIARTPGANQSLVHQDLDTSVTDTYWVQMQDKPTPLSGTSVTINDTTPTGDMYNLAIVEVLPSSAIPPSGDSGDTGSVELGVKFRADYDGYITGIRFYKSAANTGTHLGNLWTSSGALLASATFTNETASGWQQVIFSNPVAISANTTYVASYFAPVGHYSASANFFSNSGLDDPPIHLLQNGIDGPNGVYKYSSISTFPSSTYNAANYWVDVVYTPSTTMPGAPDALLVNPPGSSLTFQALAGVNPPAQSVTLFDEGSGTVNWTASTNVAWLHLSANSGTTPYTLNVSVNSASLSGGIYYGMITINASGNNPTLTIPVSLNVTNLLLSTNFATQAMQGWLVSSLGLANDWSVVNQAPQYTVQFNGGGNSQIYTGNTAWTDYTVNVPIKLSSLSNYPGGIRGRVNPATGAGYMLWQYPGFGKFILYRASAWDANQPLVQIGTGSAVFDNSNFHNVSLVFKGSQITALYDGRTVITATDSTYPNGLIALEGSNQVISFADILVTSPNPNTAALSPSTTTLTYSANWGGPNPAPQTVQLTAGGGGSLAWTAVSNASWLSVAPAGGLTPANLQVSVNSSSLSGGTFNGTITLISLGATNSTQMISVSLTVVTPPPVIAPSPSSLSFVAAIGQPSPPAQAVNIANGGYGSFSYTVATDSSWLSVSPASGSTPGSVNVSVNATGLAIGTYTGNVIVTASGVANSPQSIPVTLQVLSQDMTETFNDLGVGWINSPMGNASGWSALNGVYSYNGSGLSQSCTGNAAWSDYTFDTNIKLSSLSNWPGGVRARVNPSSGAGYTVWLYPGSNQIILYRIGNWNINDSSLTLLGQAALTFDTGVFHDLGVAFHGSQISVYWDGHLLITATDSSFPTGFVCLDADSQPISYSNIRVDAVQSQVTLATPSPTSLVFSAGSGTTPAPQTLNVTAGGASTAWGASVSSSAPWLTISASTTITPGVLTVSANPAGLAEGTYNATVTLSAPGATNSPISIPVTLAVKTAVLSVAPTSLNFFVASNLNATPQALQISNLGTGVLGWSGSATSSWLGLSATTGTAPSTLTISPNTSTLANNTYSDTITIASADAANSPATISVSTAVGTLLFSDNFSGGAGNWTVGPLGFASGWSVVNGTYTYNGGGHTQSWAGSSSWLDYTVATNFQLSSTSDYPGGLRGRFNTATGASYGAWLYPAEGVLRLFRIGHWNIDTDNSLLGSATGLVMDTNVHKLRLSFQGSTIKVYYDDALVITASDANYPQGAIALDVSNQPIAFSNVTVISLP